MGGIHTWCQGLMGVSIMSFRQGIIQEENTTTIGETKQELNIRSKANERNDEKKFENVA